MSGKSFAAVIAVLAIVALLGFGVLAEGDNDLNAGETMPVAELEPLASEAGTPTESSVDDFRGRWVLFNVWASWCPPCEEESPDLVAFQDEHGSDDFTIVGINTQDRTDDAQRFVEEFDINFGSLRDGSGDYVRELGSTGPPDSILVDPEGEVAYVWRGPIDSERLESDVLPLIRGEGG